jgi:nucleotide-binding universal stress UspA family protein
MKIVCGTDFSQHAVQAADVAAILAKRLNGKLALVHVFEATSYASASKNAMDDLRERGQESLRQEAARLRRTGAIVQDQLLSGSPAIVLADFAAKSRAVLVVVSSLGQIAPSRWFVGSVAERTAQISAVPTLVVRGDGAFKEWARRERALNILVGHDFSSSSDAALLWAAGLRKIGPCTITVAAVAWPPREVGRFGIGENASLLNHPPAVQKLLERDLRQRCDKVLGKIKARVRVAAAWGRPDPQLVEFARTEHIDLLAVGTNQRHGLERFWLGSVSRGVLHHAPMSVACVPAPGADDSTAPSIPVFKRVLVPTDFSKLGNQAIPFAYAALHRGGTVCLFHVVAPMRSGGKASEQVRSQIKQIEKQLRALIPAEAEARWLTTKVEVVASRQHSTAICQAAERFGADLICIGSHGRSGLSKAILGSVAHDVMAASRRPVLVVR